MIIDAKLGGKLKRFAKKYGIADKDMEAFMKRVMKEPGFYEKPEHKNISAAPPPEEAVRRGAEAERGLAERRTMPFRRGRIGGVELMPIPARDGAPAPAPVLGRAPAVAPIAQGVPITKSERMRMGHAIVRERGIGLGQALRAIDGGERVALIGESPHAVKKASVAERKAESARIKREAGEAHTKEQVKQSMEGMIQKLEAKEKVEKKADKKIQKAVGGVMEGMIQKIEKAATPVKRGRKPKAEVE